MNFSVLVLVIAIVLFGVLAFRPDSGAAGDHIRHCAVGDACAGYPAQ